MNEHEVRIGTNGDTVGATLSIPSHARGIVVFAHGSGSSRLSPRNTFVARTLNNAGFATLLLDLLTKEEEKIDNRTRKLRFDIDLLATRLISATDWLEKDHDHMRVAYFGASTGAAAAICAAAQRPDRIKAIVSRGGRPDLAKEALPKITAPTLLIVGGHDEHVLDLNKEAAAQVRAPHDIAVVPGATHLFEEPGALDEVAHLACHWFERHLAPHPVHHA